MGNCFGGTKKSTAEIAPYDCVKSSSPAVRLSGSPGSTVRLSGSPSSTVTAYIRFALLYKNISPRFFPSETPPVGSDTPTVLQIGSETVSGSREMLLHFVESRFPQPPLPVLNDDDEEEETTPFIVRVTWLQHKSMMWHLDRLARWAEDLAARGGRKAVNPAVGSPRMEVRKFGKSYSQLQELLLEHAQMEEKAIFPVLENADRGICKATNEEHARDLPIMNGIKEDIKSIGVLDSGSPIYQEALSNLSTRLKSLRDNCKEHFEEEERGLLPYMEATELSKEQEKRILIQCVDVMKSTHSHLFNFFLEGFLPLEAMQYLDLITDFLPQQPTVSVFRMNMILG